MAASPHRNRILLSVELIVGLGGLAIAAYGAVAVGRLGGYVELAAWAALVAVIELMPVPFWKVRISLGFPFLVAVALLFAPPVAAAVAFIGSFDPRELKREVGLSRALFNRGQVAIAVFASSFVFHSISSPADASLWLLLGVIALVAVDVSINLVLVASVVALDGHMAVTHVLRKLFIGNPWEFLASYLGLGLLGVVLAKLYLEVGFWSVALFVVPLFLARQMFFRSRALEEAHAELQDRERVMRRLSNRMAEERQDERKQIGSYLHDDLAQPLFQLSLLVDLADRILGEGDVEGARKLLGEIRETKSEMGTKMRALMNDLDRSPLGRKGLSEAISSFAAEMARTSEVAFDLDVADLPLPPPIQLLVYQIAHEAVMNALKYSGASTIEVSFGKHAGMIELRVHDDGEGFDAEAGEPAGHFGLTMMRERAMVAGGLFEVTSSPDDGTAITVRLPMEWLQENGATSATSGESTRTVQLPDPAASPRDPRPSASPADRPDPASSPR